MRRFLIVFFLILTLLAVSLGTRELILPAGPSDRDICRSGSGHGFPGHRGAARGARNYPQPVRLRSLACAARGDTEGGRIPLRAAGDAGGGLQPPVARRCLHPNGDHSRRLQPFRHRPSRPGCATGIERELSGRRQPGRGPDCGSRPGGQKPGRLPLPRYLPLSAPSATQPIAGRDGQALPPEQRLDRPGGRLSPDRDPGVAGGERDPGGGRSAPGGECARRIAWPRTCR